MNPKASLLDRDHARRNHPGLVRPSIRSRIITSLVVAGMVGVAIYALARLEFSFVRLGSGMAQLATFLGLMFPPSAGGYAATFFKSLGETVAIAFLGTLLAAAIALPLGFLAAKGMIGGWVMRFITRRFSDTIRGVDTLIWALIWINVVGLGPFAGVLAIMTSDIGSFTKLFSEAIEATDRKPAEGVTSTGGNRLHVMRFGVLPQVMPVLISQTLYYFESNTRSATIIGIVGAGGIGLHLAEMIRTFEWDRVAFIILMILATVAAIDFLSSRLRTRLIGLRRAEA
ncbi:MAG: phosphonate ABC transporter, permease protein PhnE [Methylobacterium sp.]|jgi:phosphonate transport system permease protein|nr:phosphonate ABC transporter, permease protein PhnE [Methylobacterium sp.]MCA3601437.1 phosphonate ABC transporter, permease protein PhnE [Methylobacterium sp.]MCA3607673.1 phosphonate ABC transporter, permease protein PhnE [Methylobacterium sp.]MCA3608085.1 phosphonate ABC transporter, permease protein PhnE [Methylobacterium sp.]MCA3613499.1 phosphonate ABC transporter, permease protein PhnE [Methylobacterium sp.]